MHASPAHSSPSLNLWAKYYTLAQIRCICVLGAEGPPEKIASTTVESSGFGGNKKKQAAERDLRPALDEVFGAYQPVKTIVVLPTESTVQVAFHAEFIEEVPVIVIAVPLAPLAAYVPLSSEAIFEGSA